jgi:hypothetical protein
MRSGLVAATAATTISTAATTTTTVAATASFAAATATTTTVAATATAAATTTAVGRAIFFRASFIDGQRATHKVFFIEAFNGFLHGRGSVHCHEGEATWTTGIAVHREEEIRYGTVIGEKRTEIGFGGAEGQVAHIHFAIHIVVLSWVLISLNAGIISSDFGFQNTNESNESPDGQLSMACIRLTYGGLIAAFYPTGKHSFGFHRLHPRAL